jgi:type I restriction enzyme S subunit
MSKVEWKKLVLVSDVLYGYPFESSLFSEDSSFMPLIRIRDVKPAKASTYYTGEFNETYRIRKGDILVGMDGEFNIGKWDDRDGLLNQRVLKIKGKKDSCIDGFLYHYMGPVFKRIEKETPGGSVKHLSAKVINSIQIPVPTLSEQNRIVGILDTFTASIDNLKEQIVLRRKQYEYYRDQLLDLEGKEGVEMKAICEVCDVFTGGEVPVDTIKGQTSSTPEYPYAVYTNGKETYGFSKSYQIEDDAVCISSIGANTGAVYYKKGRFTPAIRLKVLVPKTGLKTKYLFYAANKIDFRGKNTGSVPNINANYVKSKYIIVPSLSEQNRIVDILDKFEASIQNLEAQLAQREKQYEYYRNKLLTFE